MPTGRAAQRKNFRLKQIRSRRPRKNFYIRTDSLKKAQKVLGTRTETETVERALSLSSFRKKRSERSASCANRESWKMPSAKPVTSLAHKSLYDTSVYINAIRSRAYYEALLPHFSRSLPLTYFCAVVALELKAGCLTPAAHARVQEAFVRPFRKHGPSGDPELCLLDRFSRV